MKTHLTVLYISFFLSLQHPCSHCEQLGGHHWAEKLTCNLIFPDYALQKNVCEKLDVTAYSRYNWRDVAGQLGFFPADKIKSIEDKVHRCLKFAPMDHVLSVWEQRDPECSLERFVSILQEIERLDVVMDLGFPVDLESS